MILKLPFCQFILSMCFFPWAKKLVLHCRSWRRYADLAPTRICYSAIQPVVIKLTKVKFKGFNDYSAKFQDFKPLNKGKWKSRLFKTFNTPYGLYWHMALPTRINWTQSTDWEPLLLAAQCRGVLPSTSGMPMFESCLINILTCCRLPYDAAQCNAVLWKHTRWHSITDTIV